MTNSLSRHRAISSPKEASHGLYRRTKTAAYPGIAGISPRHFSPEPAAASHSGRGIRRKYGKRCPAVPAAEPAAATGETDTATWNAIAQAYRQEVRPTVLHLRLFPTGITAYAPGDKGSAVFVIQGVLQAIHSAFPAVPQVQSSGVYDTATKNAVQQFQELTPLPPSGTVDAATWNHLLAALRP